jgi:hypothetical protein
VLDNLLFLSGRCRAYRRLTAAQHTRVLVSAPRRDLPCGKFVIAGPDQQRPGGGCVPQGFPKKQKLIFLLYN